MSKNNKPILCLDFDGVIHSYKSSWTDTTVIPDPVTEGFFDWAVKASQRFKLVVYSSRSRTPAGVRAMKTWLWTEESKWRDGGNGRYAGPLEFEFANEKPPAFLTIDDRAVTFNGDWGPFDPDELIKFRAWNRL